MSSICFISFFFWFGFVKTIYGSQTHLGTVSAASACRGRQAAGPVQLGVVT